MQEDQEHSGHSHDKEQFDPQLETGSQDELLRKKIEKLNESIETAKKVNLPIQALVDFRDMLQRIAGVSKSNEAPKVTVLKSGKKKESKRKGRGK